MIPLVGDEKELKYIKEIVMKKADEILTANNMKCNYKIGTMIEIPRAAIRAKEIAGEADFFSFGTNDLTQMTFGFSRDDAGSFLPHYYEKRIYEFDPFAKLDQEGVGTLVKMACELGRQAKPNLKLGVCGEHGGEPSSVEFFHKVGLTTFPVRPIAFRSRDWRPRRRRSSTANNYTEYKPREKSPWFFYRPWVIVKNKSSVSHIIIK